MVNERNAWTEIAMAFNQQLKRHEDLEIDRMPIEARIFAVDNYARLANDAVQLILKKLADAEPKP